MKGMPAKLRKQLNGVDKRLPDALHLAVNAPSVHKYGAIRTRCLYGHNHDSKKEAMWCLKLHELEKEGKISLLICEPVVVLTVNNIFICEHWPDFIYFDYKTKRKTILDVKGDWHGGKRPEWVIKKKMCMALYPSIDYIVV